MRSTDRRVRQPWRVPRGKDGGATSGELVVVEPFGRAGRHGQAVRVTARLGRFDSPGALNVIAIRSQHLPERFPADAIAEANAVGSLPPAEREDLRDLPLVTIDGEDARDFDDAVFAERIGEHFRIIVAIADVAHYVLPDSALDRVARARGNSVYLPGLVVPMLPPALSEHWCSLVPGEDRSVFFAEIVVDAVGRKLRHRFALGTMRSKARLTYDAVQTAWATGNELGLPPGTLARLRAAWQALEAARSDRGALDLELPERRVILDATGRASAIRDVPHLESHRLIEDFMVAANTAAAEDLLAHHLPGLFRVHAAPSAEQFASLTDSLRDLGVALPKDRLEAGTLPGVVRSIAANGHGALASLRILRALPQATYSARNSGHFGLSLSAYAHFTSPIRRYADLLVHRALLRRLEPPGSPVLSPLVPPLGETAEHLSFTERRATDAERGVLMRAQALLLGSSIGEVFEATVSGVTRYALFVTLSRDGAEGIIPLRALGARSWRTDPLANRARDLRTGRELSLGSPVRARLIDAEPVNGRLTFRLDSHRQNGARYAGEGA